MKTALLSIGKLSCCATDMARVSYSNSVLPNLGIIAGASTCSETTCPKTNKGLGYLNFPVRAMEHVSHHCMQFYYIHGAADQLRSKPAPALIAYSSFFLKVAALR